MLRRVCSSFLVLFLWPLLLATVIGVNAWFLLLYPQLYLSTLDEADVYHEAIHIVPQLLIDYLQNQQNNGDTTDHASNPLALLNEADGEIVITNAIDEDFLRQQVTQAVQDFFAYLHGDLTTPRLQIPLKEVSNKLRQQLQEVIHKKFQTNPNTLVNEAEVQTQVDEIFSNIPASIDLNTQVKEDARVRDQLKQVRLIVYRVRYLLIALVTVSVILLLILSAINYHQPWRILYWVGFALLPPGIIISGISMVARSRFPAVVQQRLRESDLPSQVQPLIKDTVIIGGNHVATVFFTVGITMTAVAGLFLLVFILRRKR
ncbi:MAG: hypothetical protein HYV32_01465 [Candidatus Kerfeldbacteria bacterium]|nr:hypothetical protein [Candidatus Kerfeldbacteria bacterium]